jgi:hypothetical protein
MRSNADCTTIGTADGHSGGNHHYIDPSIAHHLFFTTVVLTGPSVHWHWLESFFFFIIDIGLSFSSPLLYRCCAHWSIGTLPLLKSFFFIGIGISLIFSLALF